MFNYKNADGEMKYKKIISHIISGLVVIIVLFGSFGTVGAGERGILLRFGATTGRIIDPGLYFKFPLIETVVKTNVQTQVENIDATAASQDLQDVSAKIGLNYSVISDDVALLYKEVGQDYKVRLIDPAIQDAVKAATANFTAEELITKREAVKDNIVEVLKGKFMGFHLTIVSLNITNFEFSQSFSQAIEAKVTAEQNALAAKNKLSQTEYEAQQAVAQAGGKAKALQVEGDAIRSNPGVVQLRWIEKWNGTPPQIVSGGAAQPFIIDLKQ